jgi:hypothetical protein
MCSGIHYRAGALVSDFSPVVVRERLMQEYFRRDFWQAKQATERSERWPSVIATLEQVNTAQTYHIEIWLRETCKGDWAWKAVIASRATVRITFFFQLPSDAVLFRLTFI